MESLRSSDRYRIPLKIYDDEDCLKKMSRDNWYFKQLDEVSGPISFEELFAMAHEGKLTPQMEIKNSEAGNWFPAQDIDGLFDAESEGVSPTSTETLSLDDFSIVDSSFGVEQNLPSLDGFSIVEDEDKLSSELESQLPRFASLEAVRSKHNKVQWFCRILNQELGPMSSEGLMQLLFDGELAPNDEVKSSAEPDWVPARTVAFLSAAGNELTALEEAEEEEEHENAESAAEETAVEEQEKETVPESAIVPILKVRSKQRWYCKLGGMGYGPIEPQKIKMWAEQERVEPTDLLKLGRKGEWFEAWQIEALQLKKPADQQASTDEVSSEASPASEETAVTEEPVTQMETAPPALSPPPTLAAAPPPARPKPKIKIARSNPLEALGPLMDPKILGGIAAVAVLGAVFYFVPLGGLFTPGGQEELEKFKAVHKEFLALQQKDASESEWSNFKTKVTTEMAPIIKDLESKASSNNPHIQALMWAGRDHLYKMIDNAKSKTNPDLKKFENQLKEAERIINQ